MNQCPLCSSEIQDAFGLVECPSCHKILFADFDGTLKVHEDSPASFGTPDEDVPVHELSEDGDKDFHTNWNLVTNNPPSLNSLDPVVELDLDVQATEPEEPPSIEFTDMNTEPAPEPKEKRPVQVLTSLEEINQFANSAESSLKQGALIYNLTIKNIDTQELKDEILEVLKESKLGIDVKKLKFALPTLELKDLNPVKVSVIVSRIKHLSVDVEWVQRSAITNGESST